MKTCVIADRSPVVRKIASHIFADLGYVIIEAENGTEVLRVCERETIDMVVIEDGLENPGSLDVIQVLCESDLNMLPRIVLMTTVNDPVAYSRAIRAGASDVLLKPFDSVLVRKKLYGTTIAA